MAVGDAPPAYIYLLQGSSVSSAKRNDAKQDVNKFHPKITDVLNNSYSIKAKVVDIVPAPKDLLSNILKDKQSTLAIVKLQSNTDIDCLEGVPTMVIPANPENLCLKQFTCIGGCQEEPCCSIIVKKHIFEENYTCFKDLCSILDVSYETDISNNYVISGNLECIIIIRGSIRELVSLKLDQIKHQFHNSIKINNSLVWKLLKKNIIGCTDVKAFKTHTFDSIARFVLAFSQLGTDEIQNSNIGWKVDLMMNENIINLHLFCEGTRYNYTMKILEKLLQKYREAKRYDVVTLDPTLEFKHRRNLALFLKYFRCPPVGLIEFGECSYVYLIYNSQSDAKDVQSFIAEYKKEHNLDKPIPNVTKENKMNKEDEESQFFDIQTVKVGVFNKEDADKFYEKNKSIIDEYAKKYEGNVKVEEIDDIHTILSVEAGNENHVIFILDEIERLYSSIFQQLDKAPPHPDGTLSLGGKKYSDTGHVPSKHHRKNSYSESLVNPVENHFPAEQTERRVKYENTELPKFKARAKNKAPGPPVRSNSTDQPNTGAPAVTNPRRSTVCDSGNVRNIGNTKRLGPGRPPPPHPSKIIGSASYVYTLTNTFINVKLQSIIEMEVDAIVNAANGELENIGGIARVIANAAGPQFDWECQQSIKQYGIIKVGTCRVTDAGQLFPAIKKVIHAVAPVWKSYSVDESKDLLYATYCNVLKEAYKLKCKQIAMSALGAGVFGIPENVSATCAVEAIETFLQDIYRKNEPSPECIYLVDIQPGIIKAFKTELEKKRNMFQKLEETQAAE